MPLITGNAQAALIPVNTIDPFTASQSETGSGFPGDFLLGVPTPVTGSFLGSGTERAFGYEFLSGTGSELSTVSIGSGAVQIDNGAGINSRTEINYTNIAPPDFPTGGADRFLITVNNATTAGTIDLTLSGGTFPSTITRSFTSYSASTTPVTLELLFSDFGRPLESLDTFLIEIRSSGTVNFGPITTGRFESTTPPPVGTPEPATVLGLLSVGILGTLLKQNKA
jgi:hypothetical protein